MMLRLTALFGTMLLVVAACGEAAPSPAPTPMASPGPTATADVEAAPAPSPPAAPPTPSPTPTPRPSAPTPSASPSRGAVLAASLPLRANAASASVALAPAASGRLFVAIPAKKGTVVALLDARGRVRRGWPVLLKGASDCEIDADPADGSVRAACAVGKAVRAYALDAAGRLMAGWPVDLPGGEMPTWMSDPTGIVDGALHVLLVDSDPASAMLVRVSRDSSVSLGVRVVDRNSYAFNRAAIGPDGTAYVPDLEDGTVLWAIDLDGVRPGFPVSIDGWASSPAFGPAGRLYLTVDTPDDEQTPSSDVVVLTADGRVAPGWQVTIPVDTWTAFGDPTSPPLSPVVTADGTVVVTGWVSGRQGTIAYALGASGVRCLGWPYRSGESIKLGRPSAFSCSCEPCVVPDRSIGTPPLAGLGGSLLLVQLADTSVGDGNRIVAIRADGKMKDGWPVTLTERGSWFASIAVTGRFVYGYAVEPAGSRRNECDEKHTVHSGTIVALDGHGDTVYATTIVVP